MKFLRNLVGLIIIAEQNRVLQADCFRELCSEALENIFVDTLILEHDTDEYEINSCAWGESGKDKRWVPVDEVPQSTIDHLVQRNKIERVPLAQLLFDWTAEQHYIDPDTLGNYLIIQNVRAETYFYVGRRALRKRSKPRA